MTSGFNGGPEDYDPFGEFLARFFGGPRPGPRQIDIGRLLSQPARELVRGAAQYAAEHGSRDLDTQHLLRAALSAEPTRSLLSRAGADPDSLATEIDERSGPVQHPPGEVPPPTSLSLTPAAKRALLDAHDLARARGTGHIGPEHVLSALAANPDSAAGHILNAARFAPSGGPSEASDASDPRPRIDQRPRVDTGTPTLDKYGRDLTDLARRGRIDPVIGRDEEIEQTIEVLSRRGKNNPVLIGDAGVGKTAIVEGLAQRIADGDVPDILGGRRVVALDLTGVVAGTRYRGDFEERLNNIVGEIRSHSDQLIVFIDELHTVVGAGGGGEGGSMDAGNILKPPSRAASCTSWARPRWRSTAGSRRTRRSPAASSRSWSPNRPPPTRSRSCAACATATRPTTRSATPTRHSSPPWSCRTAISPTAACRTRRST